MKKMALFSILVVLALFSTAESIHAQTTVHVPDDEDTIEEALAVSGVDLILVGPSHTENGRITLISGVTVKADPDSVGIPTIDSNGDSFAVVFPYVTENTTLDGFRLVGFSEDAVYIPLASGTFGVREIKNCVIEGTNSERYGILVVDSSTLISNVRISGFIGELSA